MKMLFWPELAKDASTKRKANKCEKYKVKLPLGAHGSFIRAKQRCRILQPILIYQDELVESTILILFILKH